MNRLRRIGLALAIVVGITGALVACGTAGGTASAASGGNASALVVRTDDGTLRGVADGQLRVFDGIPYAQPPVGGLRWAPPQPPRQWQGVRDAAKPGPRCPQLAGSPGAVASTDENCLYLNVTTPRQDSRALKPVMVWLHGGDGTGAGSDYDPARMAAQGNVDVVTLNYRIGVFGDFASPQLGRAGGDFGVQDVQAALRWVRSNAAAFGGNPSDVTLSGESSGAFTTCAVLASPRSAGLVDRAIMESSSCSAYFPKNTVAPGLGRYSVLTPLSRIAPAGAAAAQTLGCGKAASQLACLRRVPAKELLDKGLSSTFTQISYDTDVIPMSPATALRTGHLLHVPLLFGTNQDEMRLYVAAAIDAGTAYSAAAYRTLVTDTYGGAAARIEAAYPITGTGQYAPALAWARLVTDDGWACPTAGDAAALSRTQPGVYLYVFADEDAPNAQGYPVPKGFPLGAAHGLELPMLFWNTPSSPAQQQLSRTMIGYWTRFARTGDPNGPGQPAWPSFRDGGLAERLDTGSVTPVDSSTAHNCALWNSIGS